MPYVRSEETREKQRVAALKRVAEGRQAKGWKWSAIQREKVTAFLKTQVGDKNPFFGKKHSMETKVKISFANGGDGEVSAYDRKVRKHLALKKWVKNNPETVRQRDIELLETRAVNNQKRRARLRMDIIGKLGKRCASPECRWLNEDGTLGCVDPRILCIDHVHGGGTKERNSFNVEAMWKKALADTEGNYQLLCYCCNWLKAIKNNEHNGHRKYGKEEKV